MILFHFLIITYALFYLYARFTRRAERYATVTARGFRPSKYSLGNLKWVAFAAVIFIMFLKSIAPLLILVWASFFSSYRPIEIGALEFANLNNYRVALDDPRFWLEHLEKTKYYSDKIYAQWKILVQMTEKTHLKQNITFLLMKSKENNVETPLHTDSDVGDLDVVQYILQNIGKQNYLLYDCHQYFQIT